MLLDQEIVIHVFSHFYIYRIDAASDHLPIKAVFSFQEKIETS